MTHIDHTTILTHLNARELVAEKKYWTEEEIKAAEEGRLGAVSKARHSLKRINEELKRRGIKG